MVSFTGTITHRKFSNIFYEKFITSDSLHDFEEEGIQGKTRGAGVFTGLLMAVAGFGKVCGKDTFYGTDISVKKQLKIINLVKPLRKF